MFKRLGILTILLLSTVTCLGADYNFVRVGNKYYLATKGPDGSLVTKLVAAALAAAGQGTVRLVRTQNGN